MYGDVFVTFVEVRQENVLWFLQKNVANDTNTRYNTNLAKTLPTSYDVIWPWKLRAHVLSTSTVQFIVVNVSPQIAGHWFL